MRSLLALASLALILSSTWAAQANELDNEAAIVNFRQIELAKDLPATLVIRKKDGSDKAEVLALKEALSADEASHSRVLNAQFTTVAESSEKMMSLPQSELDKDKGESSSIFYYWYAWGAPSLYYYGYNYFYRPYYNYWHGGYSYWYYNWYYR